MRNKILVKWIKDSLFKHIGKSCYLAENIADDLIANGVIVPPCNVGDVVYAITLNPKTNIRKMHRGVVTNIHCHTTGKYITIRHEGLDDEPYFDALYCPFEIFGKTVFLTREEAEAKLMESDGK